MPPSSSSPEELVSDIGTDLDRAVAVLRAGGLVAIPTETVYGLAADAGNDDAVRRVYAAKGRPVGHPLIVHIAGPELLGDWAVSVPPSAAVLADACWPGPLTLILPAANGASRVVTGGRDSIGMRVPAHPLTHELLGRFGGGLAAPSANRFGRVSPTTAAHVAADLGGDVDYIIDGGPSPVGVESTIVDCTVDPPQVLRPGAISEDEVARLVGARPAEPSGPSRAPGMLASHYAPAARVLLAESVDEAAALAESLAGGDARVRILHDDDLVRFARELYSRLRDADTDGVRTVIAVLPPPAGIGHALRDRLQKAAGPR
jgi:L-threonylcarbamoyladenylate synthase